MNDVLDKSMRGAEYMMGVHNYHRDALDLAAQAAMLTVRHMGHPVSVTFQDNKKNVTGYVLCIPDDPELIARVKACLEEPEAEK